LLVVLVVAAPGTVVLGEFLSDGAAITYAAPPTRMPTKTATSVFDMVLISIPSLGDWVLAATIGGPRETIPRGREADGKRRVKPS
jgi:hypothetical protein